ncbi:hypothetical protein HDE_14222 [Halotydeus destructor]|nr:hypothetical protein HDE_14222 [Halotydeus destructor]
MEKVQKYAFSEIVLLVLVVTYTAIVLPWMVYMKLCLLHDLVKWEVKMADVVQFLYMDLGLGLMYAMMMGIRSQSVHTLRTSFKVLLFLDLAYLLYLRYLSDQDEKRKQVLAVLVLSSFAFPVSGRHVTRHYIDLEGTAQVERKLAEFRQGRAERMAIDV